MSSTYFATIDYNSVKNCFISIPKKWGIISTNSICLFKIQSFDGKAEDLLISWNGNYSSKEDTISINGLFANKLGLNPKQQVSVSLVEKFERNTIENCIKCYLKPIDENDWQVLAMNSAFIESNLLNQTRVVVSGLIFPIWISDTNFCIFVKAFQLSPNHCKACILNQLTEVVVCPPQQNITFNDDNRETNETLVNCDIRRTDEGIHSNNNSSVINSMFGFVKSILTNNASIDDKDLLQQISQQSDKSILDSETLGFPLNLDINQVLRIAPFIDDNNNTDKHIVNTVFISDEYFENLENPYFISKLTHILSPFDQKRENRKSDKKEEIVNESNEEKFPSKLYSDLNFKETIVLVCGRTQCSSSNIYICNNLRRQMGLSISSRVHLGQSIKSDLTVMKELTLCPIGFSSKLSKITKELISKEILVLIDKSPLKMLFITNGSLIYLCKIDFFVFHKSETSLFVINSNSIKELSIDISEPQMCSIKPFCEIALPLSSLKDIDDKQMNSYKHNLLDKPFAGYNDIFTKCINFLKFSLNLNYISNHLNKFSGVKSCSLLITGQKGSGKSHLINTLLNDLVVSPHYVYVQYIDCSLLKGKRIESLQKSWNHYLAEAFHRQPSVMVFEDLDSIAFMPSKPGQEIGTEAIYAERVSLLFMSLIEKLMITDIYGGNQVAFIGSAKSRKSLHESLVQTRGKHIFHEVIELSSPDLQQRIDIMSELISYKFNDKNQSHVNLDLKQIGIKCKGYLPIDLSALIERAVHNCLLSNQSNSLNELTLNEDNFKAAFDGFSPINLRGLDLQIKSNKKLSDVGGLVNIKKTLLETLLWPIKYPVLFSKLPLRPQSSVMLFGPPGTGKTLIIEAIANECGINFIGIKGPELLSKYVGASEQSVRDLFSRAQSAKPCILFFDEFDSLAPRRGHDSTGVTDRVVNQLLTQMDGVEALETGVYVLSATSRPDLVDPALLRPGRFDKCLYCSLPNQSERLEILKALSVKLWLSSDINLEMIASLTDKFTGADLQALLYNAQLDAIHNAINLNNDKQFNNQQITNLDLLNNESLQFIAYMPALEKGFSRELNAAEQHLIINEIEALRHNEIHLSNTGVNYNQNNNSLLHNKSSEHNLIAIEQKHLLASLENTKPSINETESKRYDKIYEAFLASRGHSFQTSSTMTKKKVTLA